MVSVCLSFITRGKKKKEESKVHRRQTKETRRRLLRACVDDHTHQKQKLKSAIYNRKARCTTNLSVECVWVGDGEQQWRGETTGTGGGGRGH